MSKKGGKVVGNEWNPSDFKQVEELEEFLTQKLLEVDAVDARMVSSSSVVAIRDEKKDLISKIQNLLTSLEKWKSDHLRSHGLDLDDEHFGEEEMEEEEEEGEEGEEGEEEEESGEETDEETEGDEDEEEEEKDLE
jgi:hypothetical protein